MTTTSDLSLKLTRVVQADPATVFQAWTKEDQLKKWFAPEGMAIPSADVELKVGGRYRVRMQEPDGKEHIVVGEYREISPPTRLVMTWRWESSDADMDDTEETLITVELAPQGDGATEVTILHEKFATAESREGHTRGWESCFDRLEALYA